MGTGGECEDGVGDEVNSCRGGLIIAAWSVGGEVILNIKMVIEYPELEHKNCVPALLL